MKFIYLDQNKWIELLKGINNDDERYKKLHEKIINNVKCNLWAFPLSSIHIVEAMKRKDETSRKQLLDLFFSVSKGYSIYDYMTIDSIEFDAWVITKGVDVDKLKAIVIQKDWSGLIGLSSNDAIISFDNCSCTSDELGKIKNVIKELIKEHCCDREMFDCVCNVIEKNIKEDQDFYYNSLKKGRESFLAWKSQIKDLAVYKDKHVYPAYLIKMFFEVYRQKIQDLPNDLKINLLELFEENSKNKTKSIANLETLPGFNVHNRLIYELYKNPYKEVHQHDFNDLAYLRIAIPYCDIVIGEKYWCDRIENYKLDKKYNAIVSTDLFYLDNLYYKG